MRRLTVVCWDGRASAGSMLSQFSYPRFWFQARVEANSYRGPSLQQLTWLLPYSFQVKKKKQNKTQNWPRFNHLKDSIAKSLV